MPLSPRRGNFDLLVDQLVALDDSRRGMFKAISGEGFFAADQVARQVELRAHIAEANTMLKALVDQGALTSLDACKYQAHIHRLERGLI